MLISQGDPLGGNNKVFGYNSINHEAHKGHEDIFIEFKLKEIKLKFE